VAWLVWTGIGALLAVLLAVSWWYDRDARRHGGTPLSAGQMNRARRGRLEDTWLQETQVLTKGATPRTSEAARDIWAGRDGDTPRG
jgi:hypothetical protein